MEYRRRLIALHQDERGYSPQGKRSSGLVSIEVKGKDAFISFTAKDLAKPQDGKYIAVLFPCKLPYTPYIVGEIVYNERGMLLTKTVPTSALPYDIDDYKAAAIIFVGSYIGFALVGQSDCILDWMLLKSSLRLKGPGALSSAQYGTYQSHSTAAPKPPKQAKDDMPLSEYGKAHFVGSSDTATNTTAAVSAPYANDFEKDEPFKEAAAAKVAPLDVSKLSEDEETFSAQGFDYSELLGEDESSSFAEDSSEASAHVHYDKGPQQFEQSSEAEQTFSGEIEDAKGFDYNELVEGSSQAHLELSDEDAEKVDSVLSEQIDEAVGFDYNELIEQSGSKGDPESFLGNEAEETFGDQSEPENELLEVSNAQQDEVENELETQASEAQANSYMTGMTNEQYMQALDPFGQESERQDEPTWEKYDESDIDPCIYDKSAVMKKMNTCRRYGTRIPVKPFPSITNSTWYKVEYPGMGSSFHYLVGAISDDNGNIKARCTAVPGPYGINPPAGLSGFSRYMTAQGLGNAGYWLAFVNPKTGRPLDTM